MGAVVATSLRYLKFLAPSVLALSLTATSANALTINYGYTSGLSSDSNRSTFEPLIQSATSTVAALFDNSITVNILFAGDYTLNGGASSQDQVSSMSYNAWTGLLDTNASANPTNTVLNTAVQHFSQGNDSSGSASIAVPTVNQRALGVAAGRYFDSTGGPAPGGNGQYDGVITITPNKTSVSTIEHEINEILGGGGQGSQLLSPGKKATGLYGGLDLYRYFGGTASFDNATNITAYLSVDGGGTSIANFNQSGSGDYGDFTDSPCNIQSAFVCTGAGPYTNYSPEYAMMEALGYDGIAPYAAPLPASLPLLAGGLGVIGLVVRRRKRNGRAVTAT